MKISLLSDMKDNNKGLLLLTILFLGLFLRIYDLGTESIWLDEGFSIGLANSSILACTIGKLQSGDFHPPLYYILLFYWTNLFGYSEFSVRFLSVIFGFLTIFMINKLGNQIFDEEVGVLSSLLLGLSIFHIQYSQDARMYSLMALLTSVSMYTFLKLFEKNVHSRKYIFGYILSSILLIYNHYFGIFIIIAENIYFFTIFLLSKKHHILNLKKWVSLQFILVILYMPWIIIMLTRAPSSVSKFSNILSVPPIRKVFMTFVLYSNNPFIGNLPFYIVLFIFMLLSLSSLIEYEKGSELSRFNWKDIYGSFNSYSKNFRLISIEKLYLLTLWLFIPIILPFLISLFIVPVYLARYTIGASLAFYLLIAKGISNINHKHVKLTIVIIIISLSAINVERYYSNTNKAQWREIANYIDNNAQPEDLVLMNFGSLVREICFEYYSKRTDITKKTFQDYLEVGDNISVTEEYIKELNQTINGKKRIWLILYWPSTTDPEGLLVKTLSDYYDLTGHEEYRAFEIYLFVKVE